MVGELVVGKLIVNKLMNSLCINFEALIPLFTSCRNQNTFLAFLVFSLGNVFLLFKHLETLKL